MIYGNYYSSSPSILAGAIVVSFVLAVVLGIVAYVTFLSRHNEGRYTGFLGWLYDFLNFRKLMAEALLKIIYLIVAIFITLYALSVLFFGGYGFGLNFLLFLFIVVVGNILLRLVYEFMLVLVLICKNTSDISRKLGASKDDEVTFTRHFDPQRANFHRQQPPHQAPQQPYNGSYHDPYGRQHSGPVPPYGYSQGAPNQSPQGYPQGHKNPQAAPYPAPEARPQTPTPAPVQYSNPTPAPTQNSDPEPAKAPAQNPTPAPAPVSAPESSPVWQQAPVNETVQLNLPPDELSDPAPQTPPQKVFCEQCGLAMDSEDAFCTNCGTPVNK